MYFSNYDTDIFWKKESCSLTSLNVKCSLWDKFKNISDAYSHSRKIIGIIEDNRIGCIHFGILVSISVSYKKFSCGTFFLCITLHHNQ